LLQGLGFFLVAFSIVADKGQHNHADLKAKEWEQQQRHGEGNGVHIAQVFDSAL
jgi:hypothetical protein